MMRVSLFGLFPRRTSLMEPWLKPLRLVFLVFVFIWFYRFYVILGDIWCCSICPSFLFLTCSCMHVLMTRFSIHAYDLNLSIHMCLSLYAIWHSHHHSLGCSDSPRSSLIDVQSAQKIQNFRFRNKDVQVLNSYRYSKWLCGSWSTRRVLR